VSELRVALAFLGICAASCCIGTAVRRRRLIAETVRRFPWLTESQARLASRGGLWLV
jgi:hypothetical protein